MIYYKAQYVDKIKTILSSIRFESFYGYSTMNFSSSKIFLEFS